MKPPPDKPAGKKPERTEKDASLQTPNFITNEMLREIRNRADWRRLFEVLGLEQARGSKENDWWASSPFSEDRTASFHINDRGWYCHSTHQGGGVVELVQRTLEYREGRAVNCYEAGRWLVEAGVSEVSGSGGEKPRSEGKRKGGEMEDGLGRGAGGTERGAREANWAGVVVRVTDGEKVAETGGEGPWREGKGGLGEDGIRENRPIRQTLVPGLDMGHQELGRRGISRETCEYLGCGHLGEGSRSSLAGRMVFQVRGVRWGQGDTEGADADSERGANDAGERLRPVILTHMGRAMTEEQREEGGKWKLYAGFEKTLELYNIDNVLLDDEALQQAREVGHVLVVEGCYDVTKLVEADIRNVVATFGAHLSEEQLRRLDLISEMTGAEEFVFWYDRDKAGTEGREKALDAVRRYGSRWFGARGFDWDVTFPSSARGEVGIPEGIGDVCEFSVGQLRWLREKGLV